MAGDSAGQRVSYRDVRKVYSTEDGPLEALAEVNMEIEPGSITSLLGPSGCGKSTLLLLTAGLIPITSGSIEVGGELIQKPSSSVGVAFQNDLLLEWRNVLDNVLLQAEMRGLDKSDFRDRAEKLLELVGLEGFERKFPAELSGGMRQRVSLARALVMDLQLLLLDEPFGSLDALTRDQLNVDFQFIWWNSRPTVIFVTHSISEAVFQGDKVVIMTPRPARIREIIEIDLPRPRRLEIRGSDEFREYETHLRELFLEFGVLAEPDYGKKADLGYAANQ